MFFGGLNHFWALCYGDSSLNVDRKLSTDELSRSVATMDTDPNLPYASHPRSNSDIHGLPNTEKSAQISRWQSIR